MTLPLLTCYVVFLFFRPRLAACIALASFAWLGWTELMLGSPCGVISAVLCGVIYTTVPLTTHWPDGARVGRA